MARDETITCTGCGGERFPEGIGVVECSLCGEMAHPGCVAAHEADHQSKGEGPPSWRQGTLGAYGVIRWRD